jgi:Fe2+ or Zn2+ uptake regulation protein
MSQDRSPGISDPEARIERGGHRLTAPRRAVLAALAASPEPMTIEDLADQTPKVGRATVFRTVKLLQDLDLVCRVPLEDGSARYLLSNSSHHHHLICRTCGSVTEFSSPEIDEAIEREAGLAGFRLDAHAVELYGLCSDCRTG